MAGEMKPIDPNAMIYMAKALRQGQKIPVVGDALFGDAAQSAEDIAYGFFPGKGSGMTTQFDPGVADLAGYASSFPGIAAKLLRKGGSAIGRVVDDPVVDMGRREAMRKIGQGTLGAATLAGGVKLADEVVVPAVKAFASPVAKSFGHKLLDPAKSHIRKALYEAIISASDELGELGPEELVSPELFGSSKFNSVVDFVDSRLSNLPEEATEFFRSQVDEGQYATAALEDTLKKYSPNSEAYKEVQKFDDMLFDLMESNTTDGVSEELYNDYLKFLSEGG